MAAAHVLHVGDPYFHRAIVLRAAGYDVDECETLPALAAWFRAGRGTDVVCVSEEWDQSAEGLIAVARSHTLAPIVLFRGAEHRYLHKGWDLEISPFTQPDVWLSDIARVIALARANIAASGALRVQSEQLRLEAAEASLQARALRRKIAIRRQREI